METTTAFYFSKIDKERAVERLREEGREAKGDLSWTVFYRAAKSWQLYVLTVLWMFWNTTVGKVANTVMQLWLEDSTNPRWSIYQVNNIPTAINGWNIVCILVANVYVDATGRRMAVVASNLALLLFGTIILVIWDNVPTGLHIVAYMFAGTDGPLSPIYMTWANILCFEDSQVRALTIAIMNSCGAALTTLIQQFLYPVLDAPRYDKGFKASLGFVIGMCVWVVITRLCEMKSLKRINDIRSDTEVDSDTAASDDVPVKHEMRTSVTALDERNHAY